MYIWAVYIWSNFRYPMSIPEENLLYTLNIELPLEWPYFVSLLKFCWRAKEESPRAHTSELVPLNSTGHLLQRINFLFPLCFIRSFSLSRTSSKFPSLSIISNCLIILELKVLKKVFTLVINNKFDNI